jgi:hypothetical protein
MVYANMFLFLSDTLAVFMQILTIEMKILKLSVENN